MVFSRIEMRAGIVWASHKRMFGEPGDVAHFATLCLLFVRQRQAGDDRQRRRYDTYYHTIYRFPGRRANAAQGKRPFRRVFLAWQIQEKYEKVSQEVSQAEALWNLPLGDLLYRLESKDLRMAGVALLSRCGEVKAPSATL